MSRIQQGRYDRLLRRVADLKGPGSKVNDALEELFPVIDVENVPAELYALNGWQLGFGGVVKVASAGNNNIIQLFNPVGSNHFIVPTRIIISTNSVQNIEYGTDSGPLANSTNTSFPRDTRRGISNRLVGQLRDVSQPGSLPPAGTILIPSNRNFDLHDLDGIFVLAPGTGIDIGTTSLNTQLIATFHWRERVAEPSELSA